MVLTDIICKKTMPSLIQIIACRQFGTKPYKPIPILQIPLKFEWKYNVHARQWIRKCLQSGVHLLLVLYPGLLLLTWFNFNPGMDKQSHANKGVGWNYLSIPKLHRLHRWSLGIDK